MITLAAKKKYPRGVSVCGRYLRARVTWHGKQVTVGYYFTVQDAQAALAIARSQIARETFIPPAERRRMERGLAAEEQRKAVTVRAWSELWIESVEKAGASPGTVSTYRSVLRSHIVPALGELRLVDVLPDQIMAMLDAIETDGARDLAFRVVRSMFNAAAKAKAGTLEISPMVEVDFKQRKARPHLADEAVMTPEEVDKVAALMPEALRIGPLMGAWCSMRLGELLGAQRRDIRGLDGDTPEIVIERQMNSKANPPEYTPPKAGSVRTVAIPANVVPALRDHLDKYVLADPTAPLLPSPWDETRPISQSAFDRHWREARDKVRPGFRFHNLRHTGLTLAAQAGATLRELMERAGHTDVAVALKYQHATRQRDRELAARMAKLAAGKESDGE